MSVAGIYQYFPNSDSIIDAYLERASSQIDSDVIAAVSQLEVVTIRRVLEAAVITHVRFYERNSELVEIWLSATSDSIVLSRARERNEALGHMLRDAFLAADFLGPAMPEYGTDLVVEVCASAIEFAFRTKRPAAEREDIAQLGINMVIPAIEGFMTPRGLKGISAQEFIDALTQSAVAVTTRPRRD